MKKHTFLINILLSFAMLLCSFSLYAGGNTEIDYTPVSTTLDLSQADNLENPNNYTNNQIQAQNLPGYVGRIHYTGQH